MNRLVAVFADAPMAAAAPPGVDRLEFLRAMTEDACELVSGLELVLPVLALGPGAPGLEDVTWPGTPVLRATGVPQILDELADLGAEHAAVVAGDAPDLPGLLIGKLFRALGHSRVAACPADGGGLVALAVRLPRPAWLTAGLDDDLAALRATAPGRRDLGLGPGWHRLRTPTDVARLDPGLEGWEATRALLEGRPPREI